MPSDATEIPEDPLAVAWLRTVLAYGRALERLARAEMGGRVTAQMYASLVDGAIDLDRAEKALAAEGRRPPELPEGADHAALNDMLAAARDIVAALPAGAPKKHVALFKRTWCNLAAAVQQRGRRR